MDLERRSRVHGALADPSRLRIVDTLSLGDASPKELQAMLGMPSNLLAHHLHVLEGAGLLFRHRSQSDRRRSYLRLVPSALDGLLLLRGAIGGIGTSPGAEPLSPWPMPWLRRTFNPWVVSSALLATFGAVVAWAAAGSIVRGQQATKSRTPTP